MVDSQKWTIEMSLKFTAGIESFIVRLSPAFISRNLRIKFLATSRSIKINSVLSLENDFC